MHYWKESTKRYLCGGPAERWFQHKWTQDFHSSTHSEVIQEGRCKQQNHVHLVDLRSRLCHVGTPGGVGEEVIVLLLVHLRHVFHLWVEAGNRDMKNWAICDSNVSCKRHRWEKILPVKSHRPVVRRWKGGGRGGAAACSQSAGWFRYPNWSCRAGTDDPTPSCPPVLPTRTATPLSSSPAQHISTSANRLKWAPVERLNPLNAFSLKK